MAIGDRLRTLREYLGLTQSDFAKALDLKQRTYWRYEAEEGDPQTSLLEKLIAKFCVSPIWLLTGKGPMFQHTQESEAELNRDIHDDKSNFLHVVCGIAQINPTRKKTPRVTPSFCPFCGEPFGH
jgi:transcriptional regulator with XRE-family HTH domain